MIYPTYESGQPLVVSLNSAAISRLPSMCERIARALSAKGISVISKDIHLVGDAKRLSRDYEQKRLDCEVLIVQNPHCVLAAAQSSSKGSLWQASSFVPHVSYLLDYTDELYDKLEARKKILPTALCTLSKRAIGTSAHYSKLIAKDVDEVFVCGQIVQHLLDFLIQSK